MRIAVCDDEPKFSQIISETLVDCLKLLSASADIHRFQDGRKMLETALNEPCDVYFLDIDMPEISGFETAEIIRGRSLDTYIVFVTSCEECMHESFDYQPFHFVCKGDDEKLRKDLKKVIEKLLRRFKQSQKIEINDTLGNINKIALCDIVYVKSDDHYLCYYIKGNDEPLKERAVMKTLEKRLSEFDFIRLHKQYLVNMRHIEKFDIYTNTAVVTGSIKIPISKSLRQTALEKYKLYKRR